MSTPTARLKILREARERACCGARREERGPQRATQYTEIRRVRAYGAVVPGGHRRRYPIASTSTYSTSAYAEVPLGPGVPLGWRLTSATNHTVRHGQWIAQVAFS